jgi:hypothetical protein
MLLSELFMMAIVGIILPLIMFSGGGDDKNKKETLWSARFRKLFEDAS